MIYTGEASDPTVDDSGDAPPNWNYELIQHYVRDVGGNELAVYNDTTVTFWNVYGFIFIPLSFSFQQNHFPGLAVVSRFLGMVYVYLVVIKLRSGALINFIL